MYSFTNDYSEGAHPRILEAMMNANLTQNVGYGLDAHSLAAAGTIRRLADAPDAAVHFVVGGTQTNLLLIAAALRPYQAVIAAATGHVNVHEAGAIEGTGHKVLALPTTTGKLTPEIIAPCLAEHCDEHMVQPKLVYISDSTELGTVYTKAELEALHHFCRLHGLMLYLDGARLGSALTSAPNDLTLKDLAALTDAFYIGGTKNGALLGEALVIQKDSLKEDFRFMMKNRGAMLAKGFLAGIQFEELFRDGLFFDLAAHANEMAAILRDGIRKAGYSFVSDSHTNLLFPILPDELVDKLGKDFTFERSQKPDDSHTVIRLVTSWATPEKAVRDFLAALT
jgi:threonine aldolase